MALNGEIALILLYFTEFDSFAGLSRRSGRSTYIACRISSSTFGHNWSTLQRGLCAIAELLVWIGDWLWMEAMSKWSIIL